ncbi:hypothetical protein M5K25_006771 [Dendrobium thyrsiflorum]|uniref:Uncharacterized protein n=1 Tax=Dendrobium thyrsiflorum TaxID=117978 RepID=A0ABD0VDM4_DENTH
MNRGTIESGIFICGNGRLHLAPSVGNGLLNDIGFEEDLSTGVTLNLPELCRFTNLQGSDEPDVNQSVVAVDLSSGLRSAKLPISGRDRTRPSISSLDIGLGDTLLSFVKDNILFVGWCNL